MRSKRYQEEKSKVEAEQYSIADAIKFFKENNKVKFDPGVEIHMRLGIDPKKAEQIVRGSVVLPAGTGKTLKILAFVTPEQEKEAKDAGADIIGDENKIKQIKANGKIDFDVAVATPQVMKNLGPIAKTLGQKGLMPNPKTETVGPKIGKLIEELKKGKAGFRNDEGGNIHQLLGKLSFENKDLEENTKTFIDAIKKAKPDSIKGTYIKSARLTTSMGPSLKLKI